MKILLLIIIILLNCVCIQEIYAEKSQNSSDEPLFIEVLNIKDMNMRQLAQLFSCGGKWKIVVSEQAAEIKIKDTYLEDVKTDEALKSICRAYNVWYKKDPDSDIINLMTLSEYTGGISKYDTETVVVKTLHYPDAVEVASALQQLFRNRVIWEEPSKKDHDDILDDIELPLDIMDIFADRAQFAVNNNSSSSSSASRNSSYSSRNSSLSSRYNRSSNDRNGMIVEDAEREIKKELLLDALAASKDKKLDVNFGQPGLVYLSVLKGSNELMLRSNDPDAIKEFEKIIVQLDKPKPQVLLEVKVLNIRLNNDTELGVDWFFEDGDYSGGRAPGLNEQQIGTAFGEIQKPSDSLVPQGTGLDPRSFVLQGITDEIRVRLQMLQDNKNVHSLATPTLCVAHNEASKIFIGKETTVLTSIDVKTTIVGDNNPVQTTTVDPNTERKNIGTSLLITPQIHADRTATIRIVQEESALGNLQTIKYSAIDSFQSQDIDTTSVITTILAADGQISLIGGLIQNIEEERTIGVPFLMDIPLIGSLFKTKSKAKINSELIILIRPFILIAPGEAENASRELTNLLVSHPSSIDDVPAVLMGAKALSQLRPYKGSSADIETLKAKTKILETK